MPWNRVGTVSTPVTYRDVAQGAIPATAGAGTGYWRTPPVPRRRTTGNENVVFRNADYTFKTLSPVAGRGALVVSVTDAVVGEFLHLELKVNGRVVLSFDGEFSGELTCSTKETLRLGDEVEFTSVQNERFVPVEAQVQEWTPTPAPGP